ncbi:hypothetical protein T484DRAFT_1951774 [Baffinella frigidus]|nr:hypothetical protein T484DRAFT_1951774 [Cryptophyta sp. CCMP2293]
MDLPSLKAEFARVAGYMARHHCFCFYCSGRFPSSKAFTAHCEGDEDCMPLLAIMEGREVEERDLDFDD